MLRVPIPSLSEGQRTLSPEVAHYVVGVHRQREACRFVAFDPLAALEADAVIVSATHTVVVRIGPVRPARVVASREVIWLQALPKGEKMDGIVRDATELGVTRIVPVMTKFTVVKLDGPRRASKRQRWERIALEAARQCGRGDAPVIDDVLTWEDAVGLPSGPAFCLYERGTDPLGPKLLAALGVASPITFAAGPEGGLSDEEVEHAASSGFTVSSLGAFVMRAETVAAATLGALRVMSALASVTGP